MLAGLSVFVGATLPARGAQADASPPLDRSKRMPVTIPEVARDQVICFCLYTTQNGILKLTAVLYPLKDGESREVTLEIEGDQGWKPVAKAKVNPVGWTATFRVTHWDDTVARKYRVTHPGGAQDADSGAPTSATTSRSSSATCSRESKPRSRFPKCATAEPAGSTARVPARSPTPARADTGADRRRPIRASC